MQPFQPLNGHGSIDHSIIYTKEVLELGLVLPQISVEEDLIKACMEGEPLAQEKLYNLFRRKMFGICLRYCSGREQAQDALQEGFIKILTKASTYSGQGSFEGWMTRIMINTSINMVSKWSARKSDIAVEEIELESPTDIISELSFKELLAHIQQLPTVYRTIFNLYVIDGYTHPEISEMLGISVGNSKSQLSRAKALLISRLSKLKQK